MQVLSEDHPRSCGEKLKAFACHAVEEGSPPLMRGKVFSFHAGSLIKGITPAHAGKRSYSTVSGLSLWDHPRSCGEKGHCTCTQAPFGGSPPLMRGKVYHWQFCINDTGITPAHAGKSRILKHLEFHDWDHPRSCGEKKYNQIACRSVIGSPPLMRGKGSKNSRSSGRKRITPAHAGKS